MEEDQISEEGDWYGEVSHIQWIKAEKDEEDKYWVMEARVKLLEIVCHKL